MQSLAPSTCLTLFLFTATVLAAHPGGLNSAGCHNNRKTGGYHCHGGASSAPRYNTRAKDSSSQSEHIAIRFSSGKEPTRHLSSTNQVTQTGKSSNSSDEASVVLLQAAYVVLGLDVSPTGVLDEKTRRATKDLQRAWGLPDDGYLSAELVELLGRALAAQAERGDRKTSPRPCTEKTPPPKRKPITKEELQEATLNLSFADRLDLVTKLQASFESEE